MDILTAFIEHFKYSVTVPREYVSTYNGKAYKVYGYLAEGVCATCDSFAPHGPEHNTRHGKHCSCDSCF